MEKNPLPDFPKFWEISTNTTQSPGRASSESMFGPLPSGMEPQASAHAPTGGAPAAANGTPANSTGTAPVAATRTAPPVSQATAPEPVSASMNTPKRAFGPLFGQPVKRGESPSTTEKPQKLCVQAQAMKDHGPKEIVVDANGDLRLLVGKFSCLPSTTPANHSHSEAAEFLVDSRALARSSPVFAKMLYGPFSESKKGQEKAKEKEKSEGDAAGARDRADDEDDGKGDGQWRVALPDDNLTAMNTLIHIMHCRFDKTPAIHNTIRLYELYQIAVLTDKYDCTALVRPWRRTWLTLAETEALKANTLGLERISWIAWEYGDATLFEKVAQKLVLNYAGATAPGLFGAPADTFFRSTLEPNGLKELVTKRRQQAIVDMLSPVQKASDALHRPLAKKNDLRRVWLCSVPSTLFTSNEEEKGRCEAAMLGMMIQSLVTVDLWPLPDSTACHNSVSTLKTRLATLTIKGSWDTSHDNCGMIQNLTELLDAVTDSITSLTTDNQARHLAAQATKLGVA